MVNAWELPFASPDDEVMPPPVQNAWDLTYGASEEATPEEAPTVQNAWDLTYKTPKPTSGFDLQNAWDLTYSTNPNQVQGTDTAPYEPPPESALSLYERGRQAANEGKVQEVDFMTRLEAGYEGTKQSLGYGMENIGALAESVTGEPYEVTKWLQSEGRDIRQAATHRLQDFKLEPIHTDQVIAGIKEGNPDATFEFLKQSLAGTLPSTAGSVATALTGAMAGSMFGPIGTLAGTAIGAFLPSFVLNTGETAHLIHEIAPNMADPKLAAKAGAISGMLDMLVIGRAIKPLVGMFGKDVLQKQLSSGIAKETLKGAMAVALVEAPTEGAQTWVQINAALEATGREIAPEAMWDAVKEAAAAGLVGGFATGGLTHGVANLIAPNTRVARSMSDTQRISDKPLQSGMPPRDTPIDPMIDTMNTVAEGFNIPTYLTGMPGYKKGRHMVGGLGGKSVGNLDIYAPASNAIATFRNMFEAQELSPVAQGPTYSEEQRQQYGTFFTHLQGVLQDYTDGKDFKTLSTEDNNAILAALLDTTSNIKTVTKEVPQPPTKRGKEREPRLVDEVVIPDKLIYNIKDGHSPSAARTAIGIRKLLDQFHIYTRNSGLEVPYIKSYFPVLFNTTNKNESWFQSSFGKVGMSRGPTPRHMSGLGNEDVKQNFIGMLTGERPGPTGKVYNFTSEQAKGVYDTVMGARGFIEENPIMALQQDEEGNSLPTELALDTVAFTKQESIAAKAFAKSLGMNLTSKDIRSLPKVKKHLLADTGIGPIRAKHLETSRQLSKIIDPKDLVEFTDSNIYDVMNNYFIQGTKRVEYARRLGRKDEKLNLLAYKAMADFKKARENPALKKYAPAKGKEEDAVIKRMFDIADAVQGRYGSSDALMGMSKTQDWLLTLGYLRTLQLATLSSLSEPFIIFSRGSPMYALPGFGKAIASTMVDFGRVFGKGIPKTELREASEMMGLVTDYAISERLTETMEIKGNRAKRWTTSFFRLTLLDQFTKFNRVAAFEVARRMIVGDLKKITSNPNARGPKARLNDLGIDVNNGRNWLMQTGGNRKTNHEFLTTIDLGASRFVDQVVMNPRPTNRPLWMSNPQLHLFSQLKGFQTVFGNTVVQRWAKEINGRGITGNARKIVKYDEMGNPTIMNIDNEALPFINARTGMIIISATLMVMAAAVGDLSKNLMKYGEGIPDTPWHNRIWRADNEDIAIHLLQRVGVMGAMQSVTDAIRAPEFGGSPLIAGLGPTMSWVEDILNEIVHPLSGMSEKSYEEVMRSESFRKAILRMVMPIQINRPGQDEFRKWLFETVLGSR